MFGILLLHVIRDLFQTPRWGWAMIPGAALNLLFTQVLVLFLDEEMGIELETWAVLFFGSLGLSLIAWGYAYRIFVDALNGAESLVLPSWRDWWAYGLAGLWLLPIAVGYSVIVIAWLSMVISILGLKLSVIPILLTVVFYNGFLPIAFARFAAKGRVWMAFEPGPIGRDIRRIMRGDYVQTCFGLFGFSILGNMVLSYLPWGGLALASAYNFVLMVIFARIFGLLIRNALGEDTPRSVDGHRQ